MKIDQAFPRLAGARCRLFKELQLVGSATPFLNLTQFGAINVSSMTLTLLRLRDQFGVQDATLVETVRTVSGAAPELHVVAQATGNYAALVPDDLPTQLMLNQARGRPFADFLHDANGLTAILRRALQSGEGIADRELSVRPAGAPRDA